MYFAKPLLGLAAIAAATFGLAGSAQAKTNVVVANNFGAPLYYNGTVNMDSGTARWSELPLTLENPEYGVSFTIKDTGVECGASGYVIRTHKYQGGSWVGDFDFCIDLSFAEIGCLAIRVDPTASLAITKASGTHCSNQWFAVRSNEEIFSTIAELAGAASGFIP